jgi:HAD superfamily hydrolase (TIGR01549 family)
MINTIIYDFDGTIVNTAYPYAVISAAEFQKMANEQQCGQFEINALVDFLARPNITGLGTHDKLKAVNEEFSIDLTPWHEEMSAILRPLKKAIYENMETGLCKHITTALSMFERQGYKQAIASSNTQDLLDQAVDRFDVRQFFGKHVYSSKPNEPKKPEPHLLLRTAISAGRHYSNCAYVGDAISDITAAKKAGMLAIAYYPNGREDKVGRQAFINAGADILCYDFADLYRLFKLHQRPALGPNLTKA